MEERRGDERRLCAGREEGISRRWEIPRWRFTFSRGCGGAWWCCWCPAFSHSGNMCPLLGLIGIGYSGNITAPVGQDERFSARVRG